MLKIRLKSLLDLSAVFLARGASTLGGAALSLLIARIDGPGGLGQFTVFVSALGLFSMLAKRGLDTILIRSVARSVHRGDDIRIVQLLVHSSKISLMTSLFLCIPGSILLWSGAMGKTAWNSPVIFAVSFPIFTMLAIYAGYLKGIAKPWYAPVCEIGGISLFVSIVLMGLMAIGIKPNINEIGSIFSLTVILLFSACTIVFIYLYRQRGITVSNIDLRKKEYEELSYGQIPFTIEAFSGFLIQAGSFAMVGYFLSEKELGLLRAAERIALMVSFPVLAINPYIASKIVHHVEKAQKGLLWRLMGKASLTGAVIVLPALILLLASPGLILQLFGPEFQQASSYLQVFSIVHFLLVILGPFSMLMSMVGGEKQLMIVSIWMLVCAVTLYPILTACYGVIGFVVAYSVVSVTRPVLIAYLGKKRIIDLF